MLCGVLLVALSLIASADSQYFLGSFDYCSFLLRGQCQRSAGNGLKCISYTPLCPQNFYCCVRLRPQPRPLLPSTTSLPPGGWTAWSNWGRWTAWSNWGSCSVSCGRGTRTRRRTCQDNRCTGTNVDYMPCEMSACLKCGISLGGKSIRIREGTTASRCEFPWMVRFDAGCGGALIDDQHILTAAHCFGLTLDSARKKCLSPFRPALTIGEYDRTEVRPSAEYPTQEYSCDFHEGYHRQSGDQMVNDVAVIRLNRPIQFENHECVSTICLPAANQMFHGQNCTVAGWGLTSTNPDVDADVLQKTTIPIRPQYEACAPTVLCAGYPDGRTDSCRGDSGGPLMCKDGNSFVAAGIVSYGPPNCTGIGRYANVAMNINWINEKRGNF